MLKISPQTSSLLLSTIVNNNKMVGSSSENNQKLAKSDFIKTMHRVEKSSFLTSNTSQIFI